MTFDEYQKAAIVTDLGKDWPDKSVGSHAFLMQVFGLVGESGEFSEKIKKVLRDQGGKLKDGQKEDLKKELGDVLWYIAVIADYLEIPMSEVVDMNLKKLSARHKAGKISGSGDNR